MTHAAVVGIADDDERTDADGEATNPWRAIRRYER
jgi:hypothetical protein